MSEPNDILRRLMRLIKEEMAAADEASARQVQARVTSIGNTLSGNISGVQSSLTSHTGQDINSAHAGPINDTTHGNRGGGSLHAVATDSVAGFLSAADKAKLDDYPTTAGLTPSYVLTVQGDGSLAFAAAPGGLSDPTTTQGDLIRRGASLLERLAIGSSGDVLTVVAGVPAWATPAVAWANVSGKPATFPPEAHNQAWSTITSAPTTLAGYGITDAAAASHSHAHGDTTGLQGGTSGEYYHLTAAQHTGATSIAELTTGRVALTSGGALTTDASLVLWE